MKISLVAAVANNLVIGKGNDLVWKLPTDFKRFKSITSGNYIIMGRKTFESLGKPLPNRIHLVVTRNEGYQVPEGHHTFTDINDAFIFCLEKGLENIFIIGGGEIYKESIDIADEMLLTHVDASPEGDTFFPQWNPQEWKETFREFHPKDEKNEFDFSFVNYERIG